MKLIEISFQEFKKELYQEYKKLFPKEERKALFFIKILIKRKVMKILKIEEKENTVGFMILNEIENGKYTQLDYFAILPIYQSKGYGSKAILELKKWNLASKGIFIEIEKLGNGENEEENKIRQKRAIFYERLGFEKMNWDFTLFSVTYTPYLLFLTEEKPTQTELVKDLIRLYEEAFGKKKIQKNCTFLKE